MILKKIHDGIYEIENYIDLELYKKIMDHIKKSNESDWNPFGAEYSELWKDKSLPLTEYLKESLASILKYTFINTFDTPYMAYVHRYFPGDMIRSHRDYWKEDDPVKYGGVLYYNDDYTGGEIFYSELNIKIKPKPLSFIIHHGDILHETIPVIDGIRYFSTTFIKGSPESMIKINPEIGIFYNV